MSKQSPLTTNDLTEVKLQQSFPETNGKGKENSKAYQPILHSHSQKTLEKVSVGIETMVLHIHEPELTDFIQYIDSLKNYERSGVSKDAGTESDDGFDLGRMRCLMDCLGNPQSNFKARPLPFLIFFFHFFHF